MLIAAHHTVLTRMALLGTLFTITEDFYKSMIKALAIQGAPGVILGDTEIAPLIY